MLKHRWATTSLTVLLSGCAAPAADDSLGKGESALLGPTVPDYDFAPVLATPTVAPACGSRIPRPIVATAVQALELDAPMKERLEPADRFYYSFSVQVQHPARGRCARRDDGSGCNREWQRSARL